jgi:hypothetical protein
MGSLVAYPSSRRFGGDLLTYRIEAAMADAWEMDWLGIAGVIQRLITDERVSGVPVWRPRGCSVGKIFGETLL